MSARRGAPAVGVDWYRAGWVAAVLEDGRGPELFVGDGLPAILERVPQARCVAVDMPIGLPDTVRECDLLAREFVGPRRNSVFMTPPQVVVEAPSYEEANRTSAGLTGKKISRQAYALAPNIRRVAEAAEADARVIEVHPEVSFCALAGEHVPWAKPTWNGQLVRRRVLERAGIAIPAELGEAGGVPSEDVLDALAAAWSARRYARGEAESLPPGARPGERQVIWY